MKAPMMVLNSADRDIVCDAVENRNRKTTETGNTAYTVRYGITNAPPPAAVITSVSFKLSNIVFTKLRQKKSDNMGRNCRQRLKNFRLRSLTSVAMLVMPLTRLLLSLLLLLLLPYAAADDLQMVLMLLCCCCRIGCHCCCCCR